MYTIVANPTSYSPSSAHAHLLPPNNLQGTIWLCHSLSSRSFSCLFSSWTMPSSPASLTMTPASSRRTHTLRYVMAVERGKERIVASTIYLQMFQWLHQKFAFSWFPSPPPPPPPPPLPPPPQSSRELLQLFSQRYLAGEGDVIRHLAQMGYTVAHTQVSHADSSCHLFDDAHWTGTLTCCLALFHTITEQESLGNEATCAYCLLHWF